MTGLARVTTRVLLWWWLTWFTSSYVAAASMTCSVYAMTKACADAAMSTGVTLPPPPPPGPNATCDGREANLTAPAGTTAVVEGTAQRAAEQPLGSTLVFNCDHTASNLPLPDCNNFHAIRKYCPTSDTNSLVPATCDDPKSKEDDDCADAFTAWQKQCFDYMLPAAREAYSAELSEFARKCARVVRKASEGGRSKQIRFRCSERGAFEPDNQFPVFVPACGDPVFLGTCQRHKVVGQPIPVQRGRGLRKHEEMMKFEKKQAPVTVIPRVRVRAGITLRTLEAQAIRHCIERHGAQRCCLKFPEDDDDPLYVFYDLLNEVWEEADFASKENTTLLRDKTEKDQREVEARQRDQDYFDWPYKGKFAREEPDVVIFL